ncbi:MAG: hypothetical protein FJ296_10785 [Planctomycetes bacterium]|nr:hypothetical protein [Planctomycetota bacterium]
MRSRLLHVLLLVALAAAARPGALAASGPWTDLGGGIAGMAGIPLLTGSGALSPGTPGGMTVSAAAPSAPALLFFSLLEVDVPFKGGTLSAYPPLATYLLATDPAGSVVLPWAGWPPFLPAGVEMFFQLAMADAAAVKGASLTNLLRGITQP